MKISLMFSLFLLVLVLVQPSDAQNSPRDFVKAHNDARAQVGVGPVAWSNNVSAFAQSYANSRKRDCRLIHSGTTKYGENLAKGSGSFSGVDAVNMWVKEKHNYDYDSNSCFNGECRHYTQVVWRNTKRIGCARVRCANRWWFITCNYDPPGNWEGEWPYGNKDMAAKE